MAMGRASSYKVGKDNSATLYGRVLASLEAACAIEDRRRVRTL